MILPALIAYYERLESDPNAEVAPLGFSRQKIGLCIDITEEGKLADDELRVLGTMNRNRHVPEHILLPDRGGRSGTAIKPNFLWDNTGYALGRDNKGKPDRASKQFEAFRALHEELADEVDDEELHLLVKFLKQWDPSRCESTIRNWKDVAGQNVVFRIRGRHHYVHERPALKQAWITRSQRETESVRGISLLTGEEDDLARLHPPLHGVRGAQTTGAAIASFNLNAFESYRKTQTFNAPVGVVDAFRYTTALNHLLADDERRALVGDATMVWWAEREVNDEVILGMTLLGHTEDPQRLDEIRNFILRFRRGVPAIPPDQRGVRFFVLGLSPNMSRLSVRYWFDGTLGEFATRLGEHVADLEMVGAREDAPPIGIREILFETAREPKDISPILGGAVVRAVLTGKAYPQTLLQAVVRRIRTDAKVHHRRAAIVRACLQRHFRINHELKEIPVSLNPDYPDPVYHMGRLFAVLEIIQADALGNNLNKTIRGTYFGSASASPAAVFPRLTRLNQHHLEKLDRGRQIHRERQLAEIYQHIDEFPSHLPLTKQGLFHIGYYHQRQELFRKKTEDGETQAQVAPESVEAEA